VWGTIGTVLFVPRKAEMDNEMNKIPGDGQMPEEERKMEELSPEIQEKVNGGVLFPSGGSTCMFCGERFDSPFKYAEHILNVHGGK